MKVDRLPGTMEGHLRFIEEFFDGYVSEVDRQHQRHSGYYRAIQSLASFYLPPSSKVLEVGSGNGDLVAGLAPTTGVGIDLSGKMIELSRRKHPDVRFEKMAAEELELPGEKFDAVILSDLIPFLYDIRLSLERIHQVCTSRTRVVIHWYSKLWQPLLELAEKCGLKRAQPVVNWTSIEDVYNLLYLANFEVIYYRPHILLPAEIPLLTPLANRYLAHLPLFRSFCLVNWIVARPIPTEDWRKKTTVSIVTPCRNEAGNIQPLVDRLPDMGEHTELIFVEGHSVDKTLDECRKVIESNPDRDIKLFQQTGKGKADAVQLGFAAATGELLMILDADLSVAPEDLPQFYDAILSGKGEFINGSRLVYTMDPLAMRFLNMLGNKVFAILLSRLLGQPIKDTLCGTKVLWKSDYDRIARNRSYFGDFDPFGDFDLLFGAAKLNLKIVEVPVRYRERTYGTTNISRFTHGWLLLKMSAKAAGKLLFIR